ncbi:hypothetical protein KSS87_013601 [Heliosperma pusillum]|nr:hypothetical protein KSS87_013601 [Heliosperma pusillum]
MVLEAIRRVLLICFVFSILAVKGLSRIHGLDYAAKTVTNEDGDTYDCIDFYKQPAFDHPLLKNHSFHPQMTPTFQPQMIGNNNDDLMVNETATDIPFLKDGGCPHGTVPIRRMNKSGGISKAKISNTTNGVISVSGTHFAISQTNTNMWKLYNGVGAVMSVYNPRALPSQYSSAEIILKGGTDSIIAGWTVNPQKYRDSKTRLFVYAVAGDMHCFDSECGFVHVNSRVPIDFALEPVSKLGGQTYINKFFIHRDPKWGAWWLQFGMKKPITIGFWPQKIFKGLQESATYAACGGEVFTPENIPPPGMGTGYIPRFGYYDGSYCREFVVVDDKYNTVKADSIESYATNDAYAVFHQYHKPYLYVRFGGPNPGLAMDVSLPSNK